MTPSVSGPESCFSDLFVVENLRLTEVGIKVDGPYQYLHVAQVARMGADNGGLFYSRGHPHGDASLDKGDHKSRNESRKEVWTLSSPLRVP